MTNIAEATMRKFDSLNIEDFKRMDDAALKSRQGLRMIFSEEIERQITEPHRREKNRHEPVVWLLWYFGEDENFTSIPQLRAICSNEYSIRYHVGALIEQEGYIDQIYSPTSKTSLSRERQRFVVERTLLDHSFGSDELEKAQNWQFINKPISIVAKARDFPFGGE